jgi:hypothetical protein
MILKALQLIIEQLNQSIKPSDGPADVLMGNVANIDSPGQTNLENNVIVSLVNLEEESTLKNINTSYKTNNRIQHIDPPVFLNLYVLFSAYFPVSYEKALRRLSDIIRFFQSRSVFTISNASVLHDELNINHPDEQSLSLQLELYTMTFEQINHLWGSLGGKQMPFAMYKMRLIEITAREITREGRLIEEIEGNVAPINQARNT